jgi:cysteine desulfurase/selenocysteine lyase
MNSKHIIQGKRAVQFPVRTLVNASKKNRSLRELVVGVDEVVPVLGGKTRRYINFDNAASTPTVKPVLTNVNEFFKWYSNVHRGAGYKSKFSSSVFDQSRHRIAEFVNGDHPERVVLFTKNATEAINLLAQRFPFKQHDVVLTTMMEHHSNDLPWRKAAQVVHIDICDDGKIDEEDMQRKLKEFRGRIRLVAVSGASNVTGYINPIHQYARWAHEAGAKIFIDAAQLAPHRPIDMKSPNDNDCIDWLAFSAHKMYAPFGLGVLVGRREVFEEGDPYMVGGGTVDIVNIEKAYWAHPPEKEEAGTPNIVGAVALAAAIEFYQSIGWNTIIQHETELTSFALESLSRIPKLKIYGNTESHQSINRLGVIPFNLGNIHHSLVASILSNEWAIGTRSGCFCAHPYVKALLGINENTAREMEKEILNHDRSHLPGTVRISFGIYNTKEEIETLCEALDAIVRGKFHDGYKLDKARGEYYREEFQAPFQDFLQHNRENER